MDVTFVSPEPLQSLASKYSKLKSRKRTDRSSQETAPPRVEHDLNAYNSDLVAVRATLEISPGGEGEQQSQEIIEISDDNGDGESIEDEESIEDVDWRDMAATYKRAKRSAESFSPDPLFDLPAPPTPSTPVNSQVSPTRSGQKFLNHQDLSKANSGTSIPLTNYFADKEDVESIEPLSTSNVDSFPCKGIEEEEEEEEEQDICMDKTIGSESVIGDKQQEMQVVVPKPRPLQQYGCGRPREKCRPTALKIRKRRDLGEKQKTMATSHRQLRKPSTKSGRFHSQARHKPTVIDVASGAVPIGSTLVATTVYNPASNFSLSPDAMESQLFGAILFRMIRPPPHSYILLGFRDDKNLFLNAGETRRHSAVNDGHKTEPLEEMEDIWSGEDLNDAGEGDQDRPTPRHRKRKLQGKSGKGWERLDDAKLRAFVKLNMDWDHIGRLLRRSGSACEQHYKLMLKSTK